ncbi:MAG TPA: metallophosphoesterase [Leptolyngbyaceae cyanobacterium]
MSFKRRQFLIFGGLSGFGLTFVWKNFQSQQFDRADANPALDAPSEVKSFTTDTEPPLLRFVSIGDTGTGTRSQYAVAEAMAAYHHQNPYDVVVMAGDNIYNYGEIEKINAVFEKPYQSLLKQGVKFYACLGNHDIVTDNGNAQVRYPGFNMQNRRYYTFRRDAVQFFALDTNNNADWQNQLVWLEKELSNSDAPWKVVFGHHQIYSSGHYGVNQPFIQTLTPLFKKYNVQLYINGHDHHYERTRSINGTTYLITGAGAGTRPVGRSEWTEYAASKLSFATYEVYRDRILLNAIGIDKQIFDRGVIPLRTF